MFVFVNGLLWLVAGVSSVHGQGFCSQGSLEGLERDGDLNTRGLRNVITNSTWKWEEPIHYVIDSDFTVNETKKIRSGIKHIMESTDIQFTESRPMNPQDNYLRIVNSCRDKSSCTCWSFIGNTAETNEQTLHLPRSNDCVNNRSIVHELGHALGLYHMHVVPDRSNYVAINCSNIKTDDMHNFCKVNATVATTYDIPYDFDSIMHYLSNELAINSSYPTIIAKCSEYDIKNATELSRSDIKKLRKLYGKEYEDFTIAPPNCITPAYQTKDYKCDWSVC